MKVEGFQYRVEINVTFTGADLAHLYEVSNAHYDARCRALSQFQQHRSSFQNDGWLHKVMVSFMLQYELGQLPVDTTPVILDDRPGRLPPIPKSVSAKLLAEMCLTKGAALTCEEPLTWRLLDTLCKMMEMDTYQEVPNPDLTWALRRAFSALRAEQERVSTPLGMVGATPEPA